MTAALAKPSPVTVPRSMDGEPPLGEGGLTFRDDQGQMIYFDRDRSPMVKIGVLQLDSGLWLSHPPCFKTGVIAFNSREEALIFACDAMAAKAERHMQAKEGEGTRWTAEFGQKVVRWAVSLKPEADLVHRASATGSAVISQATPEMMGAPPEGEAVTDAGVTDDGCRGHDGEVNQNTPFNKNDGSEKKANADPAIRFLIEAHRARRKFPVKHTVSMTSGLVNGEFKNIATCACGAVMSHTNWEMLDAAIEAHWQSHDGEPDKVDGMGHPIVPPKAAKPKRKTKSSHGAGGLFPAPSAPAPSTTPPDGAGVSIEQPAQICAASEVSDPPSTGLAAHGAIAGSFRENELHGGSLATDDDMRRRAALRAIAAGQEVDGEIVRDLIGEGYAHATTTAVLVTEEGRAFLKSSSPAAADGEESAVAGAPTNPVRPDDGLHAGKIAPVPNPALTDNSELPSGDTASSPRPVAEAGQTEDASASASPSAFELAPADPAADEGASGATRSHAPPAFLSDDDDLSIEWPSYDAYLEDKIVTAPLRGIEVARDDLHPWLKPHCKDLTLWALRLGCAAIFANFGLHKTAMQLEWCRQLVKHTGQPSLCVLPLGVRHGFVKEALQLGMDVRFIRTEAEYHALHAEGVRHFLTNYESVRDGKLDPNLFGAVSLDEASVLRSYGSKTFQEFLPLFSKVLFKLVATATPSPNRYKELIHYAGFLGVMDTGLALTRWFQRNSEKAGDLTLYPHKEDEFWMFIHSFCAFLQKPSELGYSDEGYELPPLKLRWHEVPADHSQAEPERDGQGVLFRAGASSLQEAAKSRRDSLGPRIAKMMEIIAQDPDATRVLWHDLEAEREAIEAALPEVVTISGSIDIDAREIRLHDFEEGRTKYFGTKPILSGSGSNFQYHCHKAIYVGMPGDGHKFNDFIQSLYRLQRFGQQHPVEVDIIYSEDMRAGRSSLEEKWARDTEMRARMSEIIKAHGLNTLPLRDALLRSIGVKRVEFKGENFIAINNDAVTECRTWLDNSVDLIVSSIPFGKQYEYSASYRDFGHCDDNAHFWSQMDFLSTELLRMLKPGRLACIHVKDRILFGAVTGQGVPTVEPFHAEAIMHYRTHGFQYMGMITVVTDVVRENNQTYRLGWSEMCKDGTKMGVGMPEYILLLRKPQSDRSRGYADVPVVKEKKQWVRFADGERKQLSEDEFSETMASGLYAFHQGIDDEVILDEILPPDDDGSSRARWQIDAHGFWRSSGNRLLTAEEFAGFSSADLARAFAKTSAECVYDYEAHVKIGEAVERTGTLPATFMAIAPGSRHPHVWTDVHRMRTLNMLQQRKGAEMHLCPLQFDIVDRLIARYSNKGDLVLDMFGGLGTVAYRSLLKKRRGVVIELSTTYYLDSLHYLHAAEEKMAVPEMFDLAALDASNTPPAMT